MIFDIVAGLLCVVKPKRIPSHEFTMDIHLLSADQEWVCKAEVRVPVIYRLSLVCERLRTDVE